MLRDTYLWKLACELARSGSYANVIMIEKELRRRGLLAGAHLTTNVVRRELLTRVCHAVRSGGADEVERPEEPFYIGSDFGYRAGLT